MGLSGCALATAMGGAPAWELDSGAAQRTNMQAQMSSLILYVYLASG